MQIVHNEKKLAVFQCLLSMNRINYDRSRFIKTENSHSSNECRIILFEYIFIRNSFSYALYFTIMNTQFIPISRQ